MKYNTYSGRMTKYRTKQKNIVMGLFISFTLLAGVANAVVDGLKGRTAKVEAETSALDVPVAQEEPKIDDLHIIEIEQRWVEPIENASKEFNVDPLLIYGIANAESGLGKYFYNEYDRENCHNLWGLKGGNTATRIAKEGSYLRCFNDEVAGARTVAKTLKNFYIDEGRDTPEEICQKWIGAKHADKNCPEWVRNVNKILAKN